MSPLAFIRSVRRSRDRGAAILGIALASYALFPIALLISDDAAHASMARFHLRPQSFLGWLVAQPSPWMYNFENRFLVSERPLSASELESSPWQAANHQPARAFTFADGRARFLEAPGDRYFYLESRYRDQRLRSAYRAHVGELHEGDVRPVTVIRLEAP